MLAFEKAELKPPPTDKAGRATLKQTQPRDLCSKSAAGPDKLTTAPYMRGSSPPSTIMSGDSQVIVLPEEFRLEADEVFIFRRGDELVIRETKPTLAEAFDLIVALPEGMIDAIER